MARTLIALTAAGAVTAASLTLAKEPAVLGEPGAPTTVSTGWTIPWGTSWLPDGSAALVTERDDFRVWRLSKDGRDKRRLGTVPESLTTGGEGGLMGIAVDPDWATNHHVYVMHTSTEGNRIARMTYDGTTLSGYKPLLKGIKKNKYHNGGRLAFGPDGYLYATTGDAQDKALAQDRNSLNGKILRLTKDGKPAPGNPFGNHVYSMGHRNPQGIAFDAQGRLWGAEFGDRRTDELNLIKPGGNYGWPICEGTCDVAGMTNPKKTWSVAEASPSGVAVVDGAVYMAALRGKRLWRVPINADNENVGTAKAYYVGAYGRLRSVTAVPGADALWLSTTNADGNGGQPDGSDKIFRVPIG
ncbi:PQQ-dependent sugar dehydrogenase [Streptomyces alboniger]|uniref:PQQ-dependent sugar dehydrogenase n=1 Tax=Streptomyces alboniger TaxID=132473 RepID=A0A5J6HR69_STRAD|nr:PQQ-dependent sugar dehydrogenase [Streptomyces alboniger]QEV21304.1 PQQ-dependent sugar dehydrogenase [Streptomyces alboniger]